MGYAGSELTERRQFLAHDYLVLHLPKIGQHALQLIVLSLELFRQLLH